VLVKPLVLIVADDDGDVGLGVLERARQGVEGFLEARRLLFEGLGAFVLRRALGLQRLDGLREGHHKAVWRK